MKGLAHIGVLAALEEQGTLPLDVVGSSVGALVGAAWCAGLSPADLTAIALELKRSDLFRLAHRDMALKRMSSPALYRREPFEHFVKGLLGDITFRELKRPFLVNTLDLATGRQVFWGSPGLTDVPVAEAVLASCALPAYLPPREIQGRFFVDGAAVSNLPVRATVARDRDLVVAVDVGSTASLRNDVHKMGFAAVYARAIEFGIQTMRISTLRHWDRPPILLMQPQVDHISLFSFRHSRELLDEGYRAALCVLRNPEAVPPKGASGVFPRREIVLRVERDRCIGCGACRIHGPPGLFAMDDHGKAVVTKPEQQWNAIDAEFLRQCPTNAIVAIPQDRRQVSAA
jgi:NTE family protein